MKLLFIGGTGNISTDCAALLHARGHEILVVSRGHSSVPPMYRAIQADRKDLAAMRMALKGVEVDVVLNFLGFDVPEVQIDCELFRDAIRQYVYISSATVYAKPPHHLPITEDEPLGNPWSDYAQKKLACEQWLFKQWKETGFPATIIRPSHTYSENWVPNPVSSASYTFAARIEQCKPVFVPDDGQNPWTLTAASDFAVGLGGLVGITEAVGEAFHITSDEALTWNQICSEIAAAVSANAAEIVRVPTDFICKVAPQLTGGLKGDKSHPGVFDNSKIKRFVPEFQCHKPFRTGVRESANWLREHPERKNLDAKVDQVIELVIGEWRKEIG